MIARQVQGLGQFDIFEGAFGFDVAGEVPFDYSAFDYGFDTGFIDTGAWDFGVDSGAWDFGGEFDYDFGDFGLDPGAWDTFGGEFDVGTGGDIDFGSTFGFGDSYDAPIDVGAVVSEASASFPSIDWGGLAKTGMDVFKIYQQVTAASGGNPAMVPPRTATQQTGVQVRPTGLAPAGMTYNAQGQLVPIPGYAASAGASLIPGISDNLLMIGAAAGAALILLSGNKRGGKRRR
jgi:hypothetical protein